MRRLIASLIVVVAVAGRARAEPAATPVVQVNAATEEELTRLPGIGPARAAAIVAYRKKSGPFKRTEDVLRVRGIGRKTLARLRPYLTVAPSRPVDGAPPATAEPPAPPEEPKRAPASGGS